MKVISVGNKICGSNGCKKEANRNIEFRLGFSAGFCEHCANDLMVQGLTIRVTEIST